MRRKHHANRPEEPRDLELLPLMNLFVVLIPMLLLSAVFLELAVIKMNLPNDEATPPATPKEQLGLSVAILDESWVVKGRKLETRTIDRLGEAAEEDLRAALADVTGRFPSNQDVTILSESTTRYDDIVLVMDVSRESGLVNVGLGEVSR